LQKFGYNTIVSYFGQLSFEEVFMDYIKRDIERVILDVSGFYSVVLVTGPRQVGKTTPLRYYTTVFKK